jgi:hypothetical protein
MRLARCGSIESGMTEGEGDVLLDGYRLEQVGTLKKMPAGLATRGHLATGGRLYFSTIAVNG